MGGGGVGEGGGWGGGGMMGGGAGSGWGGRGGGFGERSPFVDSAYGSQHVPFIELCAFNCILITRFS